MNTWYEFKFKFHKLISFGTANIGDYFNVFRWTFILSEVRLGWVKARVGYPITPHHYR